MTVKCGECRFYESIGEQQNGECRRWPPYTVKGRNIDIRTYPLSHAFDWCGEGRPKVNTWQNLPLSTKASRVVRKLEIQSDAEFLAITERDVLKIWGIGKTTVAEISRWQEKMRSKL